MNDTAPLKIPVSFAKHAVAIANQLGVDDNTVYDVLGVSEQDLEISDSFVELKHFSRLVEFFANLDTQGQPISTLFAEKFSFTSLGVVGVAMVSAKSARLASDVAQQYVKLLFPALKLQTEQHDTHFIMSVDCDAEMGEAAETFIETVLLSTTRLKPFFDTDVYLDEVGFKHVPEYPKEIYENFLDCPIIFNAPNNYIRIHADALDAPSVYGDESTFTIMQNQLKASHDKLEKNNSWAQKITSLWLASAEKNEFLSQEQVASHFNLTVRTLARRLKEEGTQYQIVINDCRMNLAQELLENTQVAIQEIAYRIGFSDPNAFYRAFKQWSGQTPNACREAKLS